MNNFNNQEQQEILDAIRDAEEEQREQRRAKKLSDIKNKVDECKPCQKGVMIQTAHKVCRTADKPFSNKTCDNLHQQVVMEEIEPRDYLYRMRGVCGKDKQAKDIIQALLDHLDIK